MDRLDFVLRRYKQIVPKPVDHVDVPLDLLQIWLTEDVSTVLDDYTRRPAFREHASWSVRTFRPGSQASERILLDRIDLELVECAEDLVKFGGHKLVKRKLEDLFPPVKAVTIEKVILDSVRQQFVDRQYGTYAEIDSLHGQVEAIAKHLGCTDLVNVNDYFEPRQESAKCDDGKMSQFGDLIVSVNPDLLPAGNYIVRCLLKRIACRREVLESYRRMCLTALAHVGPAYKENRQTMESAWARLSESINDLTAILRTGQDMRLRDACAAATQTYAAFHPRPEMNWLGLDPDVTEHGCNMLKARSTGLQNAHFFDRIAVALGELKHLYEDDTPNRSAIEEAIATGGLIISVAKGEVYWQSQPVSIPPQERPWRLLVALARKAQRGAAVEVGDVYDDQIVSKSAMSTIWNRLKKSLPPSLHGHVRPGAGQGTYRLNLESHLIHVFT